MCKNIINVSCFVLTETLLRREGWALTIIHLWAQFVSLNKSLSLFSLHSRVLILICALENYTVFVPLWKKITIVWTDTNKESIGSKKVVLSITSNCNWCSAVFMSLLFPYKKTIVCSSKKVVQIVLDYIARQILNKDNE